MAAQAGGDGPAGIGTRLRTAREKKGLTVLQAAEKLHVDPRIVEALESEDFAALGAAVYARGHLRHYAELVNEQPAELQELYSNSTRGAPTQPDLTRMPHRPPEPNTGKLVGPAVVVLVAIASIGTVWWLMAHPTEKPLPALVHHRAQPTPLEPESSGEDNTQSGKPVGPAAAPNTPGAQPTTTPTPRRATPKAAPSPAAAAPAAATPAPPTKPATGPRMASLDLTNNTSSATAPPTTRGKEGQLTLKFSSDSWAEVYDAAGQRLFYDVGAASSAHTVKGPAPMRIVLGNGAGVALEFNGRPMPVPAPAAADGSVRFVINAHGRAVPATNGE
jgi:cytoskeleton protein RodZ